MQLEEIIHIGKRTINLEAEAIRGMDTAINEAFAMSIQQLVELKGRLVVSGIGKSAIVAQKIVATLNSTGTPSLFMHAADAIHGDLGMIQQGDVVMLISKSGDSPEIKVLVPLIKNFGNTLIGMVGQLNSFLATQADIILNTTVLQEACPNNLAPTSSTTAQMVMGDALAICLMETRGFGSNDFAKFHPGGTLGKKLYLRVGDLSSQNLKPGVKSMSTLKEVIIEITNKRLGVTAVLNDKKKLEGIITDGDLRRMLEKDSPLNDIRAKDIMSINPRTITEEALAIDALDIMRKNNISQLIVLSKENAYMGIIHLHDIVREGII
ncbi:MAG: KpsF/GutQ family sugar-phosphate isomerase [Chitinophagaceae bacterium]